MMVEHKYNPGGYDLAPNDADVTVDRVDKLECIDPAVEESVADLESYGGYGSCTDDRPHTDTGGGTNGESDVLRIRREINSSSTEGEDKSIIINTAMTAGLLESMETKGDSQQRNKTMKTKRTKRKTIHGNTNFDSSSLCVASEKSNKCNGTYECQVCNKTFKTKGSMKWHMNIHDKVRFPCTACGKTFSTHHAQRAHTRLHTADLVQCDVCEKVYTNATNLQLHRQVHDGSQAHPCDICDSRFSRKADLDRHYMIHTGDYNFTCAVCDHGFIHKGDYNRHMLRHTGEGGHQCPYCDKVLVRRVEMQRHLSTHEESGVDVRPKCTDCGSVFSSPWLLKKHMRVFGHGNNMQLPTTPNVNELTCSECSKVFTRVGHLNKHVRDAHGDDVNMVKKAFSCEQCTISCRTKRGLNNHVTKVHVKARKFQCSICGKGFANRKSLTKHELMHEQICGIKLEPGESQ